MKTSITAVLTVLIIIFLSINCQAQSIGKLFGKAEADILFGQVEKSVDIKASVLLNLIEKSQKKVMFRFVDGDVLIAGDGRKVLNSTNATVNENDIFMSYSKEKVLELINKNSSAIIQIEKRANTVTLTNNLDTLEESVGCPPDCW